MVTTRGLLLTESGRARPGEAISNTLGRAGELLRLGETEIPDPGPGQVLIAVRRATVNPSDVMFVQGVYGRDRVPGAPAGFEGVGRVIASGGGLYARWLKGRDVAFYASVDRSGAWAEHVVTDAGYVLPLRKGIADRDGAALMVNPGTAVAMVGLVPPGNAFVASAAASQLGKLMAGLARDEGKPMIALVRRDEPVETLRRLGASHVLNERAPDFEDRLRAALAETGARIFFDAVGGGPVPALVFEAMPEGARWVIYGGLAGAPAIINQPGQMIFEDKRVEGFWMAKWAMKAGALGMLRISRQVQKRFLSGQWTTDVAAELPLDQAIERLPQALAQPDGKVQIVMPGR